MDFSKRFYLLRKSLPLTQTEFGKLLGLTQQTISGLESGTKNPSKTLLRYLEYRYWCENSTKTTPEKSSDSSKSNNGARAIAEYVREWASKSEKENFQPIINALCLFLDMVTKEHDGFRDRLSAIEQDMREEKSPDGEEHRKLWKKYMRLVK